MNWYLILSSHKPGNTLLFLNAHYGDTFPPHLRDLVGVQQSPEHHPEGDAFNHTCHVLNAMDAICRRDQIPNPRRLLLMTAALCHDFGKASTTRWREDKQKWTAYGHDVAGVALAESFVAEHLADQGIDVAMLRGLVRMHMVHCRNESGHTDKAVRKILRQLEPGRFEDLVLLCEADCGGRPPLPGGLPERFKILIQRVGVLENAHNTQNNSQVTHASEPQR